jgi:Helix-turn-helix domain
LARAKDRTLRNRLAFSIPEWAAAMGVNGTTAYRWADAGLLPTFRIGRRRFVSHGTVERQLSGELALGTDSDPTAA